MPSLIAALVAGARAMGDASREESILSVVVIAVLAIPLALWLVRFLRRELADQRGDQRPERAARGGSSGDELALGPMAELALAGAWILLFPVASMIAWSSLGAALGVDERVATVLAVTAWASVPVAVGIRASRRAASSVDADDLREATRTDRFDVHVITIAVPAALRAEVAAELAQVHDALAHRAADVLGARLAPGVRAHYARHAHEATREEATRGAERALEDHEGRSRRAIDDADYRGAQLVPRGRPGTEGSAVLSFVLAACPTGVSDEPAPSVAAMRERLEQIVPLSPAHVLSLRCAWCPVDSALSLDDAELADAFPELRALGD